MGKDVTFSVGGRNPDGTFSATIAGLDPGNPLLQTGGAQAPQQTAIVPWQPPMPPMPTPAPTYRVQLGSQVITFASEADWLRMEQIIKQYQQQNAPQVVANVAGVSLPGGETDSKTFLRTGAHAAEAIGGFLRDRGIRRKLDDLDVALRDSRDARRELDDIERTQPTLAPLIPTLRRLFLAERDATEAALSALEDELVGVDIQTGAGVAKVAADLMSNRPIDSGATTMLAAGGAGLGLGLLLSRDRDSDRRDRRR